MKGHAWAKRACPFCNVLHIEIYERYQREIKDLITYRKITKKRYEKKVAGIVGKRRRKHADLLFLVARKSVPLKIAARMLSLTEADARIMISESQVRMGLLVRDFLRYRPARARLSLSRNPLMSSE